MYPSCYGDVGLNDTMILEAMAKGLTAPSKSIQVGQVQGECHDAERHPALPDWRFVTAGDLLIAYLDKFSHC